MEDSIKDFLLEDWFTIEEKIAVPPRMDKSVTTDGFLRFTVLVKLEKDFSYVELI